VSDRVHLARTYYRKWRWFERNSMPLRRLRIHRELMKREAYCRWPLQGNIIESLRAGRLEIERGVHFEPHVWISVLRNGHLKLGEGTVLNRGVFISVVDEVTIGAHCAVSNGCFISDGMHNFGDTSRPFLRTGMVSKGPTRIGENVWIGVNSVVTGGVTIGDWSIVGANSVVTKDVPPATVVGGAPARVIREVEFVTPDDRLGVGGVPQ
jgi:acetyltransferase-like isoleucine patch superfamily enzyme